MDKEIGSIVIVVAIANALGYLGNAYADLQNRWMWISIAFGVGILVGIEERLRNRTKR